MAITERVDKLPRAIAWHGNLPITSRYSAGIAGERFFRAIKDEAKFLGTRCKDCDLVYVPATMFCERCFAELDEWVEVPNRGRIFTYTVLHRDLDDKLLDPPLILAYVKLEGANGGLVHYVGETEKDEIFIGMEVAAVFEEAAEREGSILDVKYFQAVEE